MPSSIGRAGVRKFFEGVLARVGMTEINTDEFVAEGDTVAIFGSEAGTARATGQTLIVIFGRGPVQRDGEPESMRSARVTWRRGDWQRGPRDRAAPVRHRLLLRIGQ